MNGAARRSRQTHPLLRRLAYPAIAALVLLIAPGMGAAQSCAPALDSRLVLLEVDPPDGSDKRVRSGVIVSQNGLVLTDIGLITGRNSSWNAALFDPDVIQEKFDIGLTHHNGKKLTAAVPTRVLAFDAARRLLLLKVRPQSIPAFGNGPSQADQTVLPMRLGGFGASEALQACLGRYKITGPEAAAFYELKSTDGPFQLRPADGVAEHLTGVEWEINPHSVDDSELGGAVFDPLSGELLGIIINNSSNTSIVPIHFADTILSQLFIARVVRELEAVRSSSDELRTGVTFTFDVVLDRVNTSVDWETPKLEFNVFVQQVSDSYGTDDLRVSKVRVRPAVVGVKNGDKAAQKEFGPLLPVVSESGSYFTLDASEWLAAARMEGFEKISHLKLILTPIFVLGAGSRELQGAAPRNYSIEIPLRPGDA